MNQSTQARDYQVGHLIGGKLVSGSKRGQPILNPATGENIGEVALGDAADTATAIAAAEAAFPAWRSTSPLKRARIMFRFKSLIEERADEIARLITREHGKTHVDALGEVQRSIENIEYACYAPEILKGEHSKEIGPGIDSWSEMQPIGVVAGITPFNFPAMVPLWMYPLAIVCGNTFVLKPSERDPSAALLVAQIAQEAGLPEGVLNVVNGDKEVVETLLNDERVQAISFVGSTPVAEYVYTTGTANGKRVQALGGAKNHAIVMPDADLDNAVSSLMGAAYGSCGERCMAISVVVAVGDQIADNLVGKLTTQLDGLKVGPGDLSESEMGPLITSAQHAKVTEYVNQGVKDGADLVVDGRELRVEGYQDGNFIGPCLFDRVLPGMTIYDEEIFGPVLCIVRAESMEQAMRLIDEHEYGNGACLFTRDGEAARYFSDNIKVGMVGINVPLPVPVAFHCFGGWKRSLFGDLHMYGPDGARFFTRRKTVTQRWPSSGVRESAVYSFPSNS